MAKKKAKKTKTAKKIAVKDIKVVEPVNIISEGKIKGVPKQVAVKDQVCYVDYVPPKRMWSDTRVHFNPNHLIKKKVKDNPFE
tara:strand:+ start:609 stop:857 length:249 start_codon:yes stop_codon:yes gene_type:complete